jgi:drug/metabolite transporter (DMT)-like permease
MFAIGGLALLAVALIADGTASTEWGSGRLWAATAWVSLGAGAVGTVAYFTALRLISSARASAWLFLVPAVAVLVELARGNVPNATTLAGMALAIGGVALVNMPATRFAPLDSSRPRDS